MIDDVPVPTAKLYLVERSLLRRKARKRTSSPETQARMQLQAQARERKDAQQRLMLQAQAIERLRSNN